MAKMGRPSKLGDLDLEVIELLASKGLTDKEFAKVSGVSEQTFNTWKKKHTEFLESLKDGKAYADGKVQDSLYKRACGWTDTEGKEYPPDTTSMIYWLKNRKPKEWRDKTEVEVSADDTLSLLLKSARERK